ncbi:DMT family transporter [Enterocloster aldenensis]|uniref:DMT family transporter n=1 Tax=Enterocloster aldenensis TaxID=358742 RepID=UPI00351777DB
MNGRAGAAVKYLPILLVMVFWGSMGVPSTYAVAELSPLWVLCLRSGIAVMVLFPAALRRNRGLRPAPGEGGLLAVLSLVGVVGCNYLYYYAVQNTALANVAILYALGPIITTVLAGIFLKETVRQGRCLGIVLAFAGVAALITNGDMSAIFSIHFNRGDLAELGSASCLAAYTILSRRLKKTPPECAVFWLMLIAFAATLPMALVLEGGPGPHISIRGILSLLYLGVLCSGLGYLLQQCSIRQIGASASAAFLNGISPITILTAALILGEHVTFNQVLCMAVVFSGLYLNASNQNLFYKKHRAA